MTTDRAERHVVKRDCSSLGVRWEAIAPHRFECFIVVANPSSWVNSPVLRFIQSGAAAALCPARYPQVPYAAEYFHLDFFNHNGSAADMDELTISTSFVK